MIARRHPRDMRTTAPPAAPPTRELQQVGENATLDTSRQLSVYWGRKVAHGLRARFSRPLPVDAFMPVAGYGQGFRYALVHYGALPSASPYIHWIVCRSLFLAMHCPVYIARGASNIMSVHYSALPPVSPYKHSIVSWATAGARTASSCGRSVRQRRRSSCRPPRIHFTGARACL